MVRIGALLDNNRKVVDNSTALLDAKRRQSDAYTALSDAKMRIVRKLAELADLPNLIAEEQRAREHQRWKADQDRQAARTQVAFDQQLAGARHTVALAKLEEAGVRASRNLEAAHRVKDAQLDQWYAEAQSRTNNAKAEFEHTVADLAHPVATDPLGAARDEAAAQTARQLAIVEHQIELERGRGNQAAVLALLNLKALLQGT